MSTAQSEKKNLPWVEKYRPISLNELISHEDIVQTIQRFIDTKTLPHLLLYGPPGTGKTSTILACAKQLYQSREFSAMVLELNASDERGIDVVRDTILSFAQSTPIFNKSFKLVILDEADAMTQDAQNALRRIMEKYTTRTRFCLICNYLSKIIPALQSRCTRLRFAPLREEQILPRLDYIITQEKIKCEDDSKRALIRLADGDMRRVINTLQSTNMAFGRVSEENVYKCIGQPTKKDMEEIIEMLTDRNATIKETFDRMISIQQSKGLALQDLIMRLREFVHENAKGIIDKKFRFSLIDDLAIVEVQFASGGSERLQLASLVASFVEVVRS